MRIAQADIFAPVLTVLRVADLQALGEAYAACEYALTVAVFGEEREALKAGETLCAGTLLDQRFHRADRPTRVCLSAAARGAAMG